MEPAIPFLFERSTRVLVGLHHKTLVSHFDQENLQNHQIKFLQPIHVPIVVWILLFLYLLKQSKYIKIANLKKGWKNNCFSQVSFLPVTASIWRKFKAFWPDLRRLPNLGPNHIAPGALLTVLFIQLWVTQSFLSCGVLSPPFSLRESLPLVSSTEEV